MFFPLVEPIVPRSRRQDKYIVLEELGGSRGPMNRPSAVLSIGKKPGRV